MGRFRRVVAAKLLSLALIGTARGDQWTFFYPEHVTHYGCAVEEILIQEHGTSVQRENWVARAWAERDLSDLPRWQYDVGFYPDTDKGLDKAMDACKKWEHAARKRVRASH